MKREMKLIRKILEFVEKASRCGDISIPEFQDYRKCEVKYHIRLCDEANYLVIVPDEYGNLIGIDRMTWQGHEELDRLRNQKA